MAILQSTTISGSLDNTGSLAVSGSTIIFPFIESSLTSSFSGSGKMWINADTQNLQYTTQTSLGTVQSPASFMGAWSAGGNVISVRCGLGGAGDLNAGLAFGGFNNYCRYTCTEEYDGTSWSAGPNLINAAEETQGAGTQTAGLRMAGWVNGYVSVTEEYNGSSGAAGGAMIQAKNMGNSTGYQNAAIYNGGRNPGNLSSTEE